MATTSITEDFVTKSGLNVQGTSTVTSSTGQSGTLQVDGGAAIAKNLIVGSTATVGGDLFVIDAAAVGLSASVGQSLSVGTTATINGNLFVYGHSRIVTMTATGAVFILETTAATTGSSGALVVTGGAALGKNLVVLSTVSSTGTTFNNAVYVAGGVGIDKNLVVGGTSVFQGDVIFNGTATYVYSANTVYTDNILELHTPNTGTPGVWNADDGKDIGLRFHYYDAANKNAALVLANDTKYLEWYVSGAEGTDTFAGGTYGTFKTGNILLTGVANAITTQSGALQVAGGVGIGRNLYVGGTVTASLFIGTVSTATNIAGGATGSIPYQLSTGTTSLLAIGAPGRILFSNGSTPYWDTIGSITPDYANTATNIRAGASMEIPFQTAAGITSFEYNLRYDYLADTLRTVNAVFTGTTNSSNTVSGALQVAGGVGIGGNIYVGQNAVISGTANVTGDTTITGNLAVDGTNTRLTGDLEVGSTITTNQSTFNLLNTTATTINFAGSATEITIGSSSGYTTIGTRTTITNITSATSTITGALRVAGGVGIGGSVYIGGQTNISGSILPINDSVNLGSLANPFAELFLSSNALYVGNVVLSSTGSQLVITSLVGPASLTIPTVAVSSSTISNSTDTGALTVVGGVGIGGSLNVGLPSIFESTAVSTGTNSGALVIAGGVGIGGTLYINTTSYINNSEILTAETSRKFSVSSITAGTDTAISTSTGDVVIWNVSTLQSVTNRGNTTDHILVITTATDASSTNSGALQVVGGVGIGGNIFVGASATVTNTLYVGDAATVATNLYVGGAATVTNTLYVGSNIVTTATTFNLINSGATTVNFANSTTIVNIGATTGTTTVRNDLTVAGNLIVHGVQTIVDSTVTNISDPIITLGSGPNNSDPTLNDNKDRGIAFKYFNDQVKTGFFGYQNSTGYLTFFTSTTINNEIALPTGGTTKGAIDINLAGGTAQSLVYQSSTDNTGFVVAGDAGYLLQSNGTLLPPNWISPTNVVSNTATNLANGTAGQVPYQTAPGATGFYGPGNAGDVLVSNGTNAPTYNNTLTLTGNTVSVGTNSGALQVVGGVGLGGDLYVGGNEFVLGSLEVRGGNFNTDQLTFNLLNTVANTINFANSGTKITIGSTDGYTEIKNATTISNATSATSISSGALQVIGGVGIAGDLYIGGSIYGVISGSVNTALNIANGSAGSIPIQSSTGTTAFIPLSQSGYVLVAGTNTATWTTATSLTVGNATTASNIAGGISGQLVYQTAPGITGFVSTDTAGNVLVSNGTGAPTYNNTLALAGTTDATSTTTGALTVAGGVGIRGNLYVGGEIVAQRLTIQLTTVTTTYVTTDDVISTYNTTASTGTTTGALVVAGGVGVGGNIYAGDNMYSKGSLVVTTATINQYASQTTIAAGTDTVVSTSTGNITIWNNSTLQSVTDRGATTLNKVQFLNTGSSTSTYTSNSVYVQGGAYINKDLTVLGTINGFTATVTQIFGNSGQFFGDATGAGALYAGIPVGFTPLPSTVLQLTGNVADYIQTNFQNIGTGPIASTDWVATADNGTNYSGFIDMGIASSQWDGSQQGSIGWAAGANDGYLYVAGDTGIGNGNLVLGSISTGSQVKISVGVPSTGSWTAVFNPANTISNSTSTGALIITGGLGVSGNIYAGGTINGNLLGSATTASNIAAGTTGSIPIQSASGQTAFIPLGTNGYVLTANATTASWTALSGLAAGRSTTATNLAGGLSGQVPYQTSTGTTSFYGPGTAGDVLVSGNSSGPRYQNTLTLAGTATSISTTTGALQVVGGVGIGGSIYVGNRVGFVNTSNVSTVYQYYNAVTNSLDTVFG